MIAAVTARIATKNEDFAVWEDNWPSFIFFVQLATQWNVVAGMSGQVYVGLNYVAVFSTMDGLKVSAKNRTALFDDLQAMELAALPILNQTRD